ncbi:MAG: hypothetical protein WBP85_09090 [Terracidiphilus sp.]
MAESGNDPIELACEGLRNLANEISDEFGRLPSPAELFEVLTWGLKSLSVEPFSDVKVSEILSLNLELKNGASQAAAQSGGSSDAVDDLDDAAFVAASDLFLDLTKAFKKRGQRLSKAELCDLLLQAVRQCEGIVAGIHPADAAKVKLEIRKGKKITGKVGDLVAIPGDGDKFFIAVIVARNAFGTAFGLLRGVNKPRPISHAAPPETEPSPIYSGDDFIEDGRWKIIDHDEKLLALFPSDPEIYHYPDPKDPDSETGPYGAAETASGRLRKLGKEEAERVGLVSKEYQQIYMPDMLEIYLKKKFKV